MGSWTSALPLLPGRRSTLDETADYIRHHRQLLMASHMRLGLTLERHFAMDSENGPVLITYREGQTWRRFTESLKQSRQPIDVWQRRRMDELTGFDLAAHPPPEPRFLMSYAQGDGERRHGFAFSALVKPGKVAAVMGLFDALQNDRHADLDKSRREKGITLERAHLNATIDGEMLAVYLEADDPVLAVGELARSTSRFDARFKARLREMTELDLERAAPDVVVLVD